VEAFNEGERGMSATFEKLMNGFDGSLALLQVLAENSFDSVLITDASAEGKIIRQIGPALDLVPGRIKLRVKHTMTNSPSGLRRSQVRNRPLT